VVGNSILQVTTFGSCTGGGIGVIGMIGVHTASLLGVATAIAVGRGVTVVVHVAVGMISRVGIEVGVGPLLYPPIPVYTFVLSRHDATVGVGSTSRQPARSAIPTTYKAVRVYLLASPSFIASVILTKDIRNSKIGRTGKTRLMV
jgi:hypothetical protein